MEVHFSSASGVQTHDIHPQRQKAQIHVVQVLQHIHKRRLHLHPQAANNLQIQMHTKNGRSYPSADRSHGLYWRVLLSLH